MFVAYFCGLHIFGLLQKWMLKIYSPKNPLKWSLESPDGAFRDIFLDKIPTCFGTLRHENSHFFFVCVGGGYTKCEKMAYFFLLKAPSFDTREAHRY